MRSMIMNKNNNYNNQHKMEKFIKIPYFITAKKKNKKKDRKNQMDSLVSISSSSSEGLSWALLSKKISFLG